MRLEPMRYKGYTFPHNPRTYTIAFERQVVVHKIPFGRYCVQDLGLGRRVLRGEGEFAGEGAYDEFKRLASLFYQDGPGILVHPVWQTASAYFTELSLAEEPLPDYVRYRFAFVEDFPGIREGLKEVAQGVAAAEQRRTVYTVAQGDTLWGVAGRYGVTIEALLRANPAIKNPNLIRVGQQVVVPV